jgi:hypothetical protein
MVSDEGEDQSEARKIVNRKVMNFQILGFRLAALQWKMIVNAEEAPGKISILFHWPVSAASTSSFPAMYKVATGTAGICSFIHVEEQEKDMKEPRSSRAGEGCQGA